MDDKIKNLKVILKSDYVKDKYLKDALCYGVYKSTLQAGSINNFQPKLTDEPYRRLENVGDRVIKLVLTETSFVKGNNIKDMNDETNNYEKNKHLMNTFEILPYAYSIYNGIEKDAACDGLHKADLIEALVGALYLSEMEENNTFCEARQFIMQYISKATS